MRCDAMHRAPIQRGAALYNYYRSKMATVYKLNDGWECAPRDAARRKSGVDQESEERAGFRFGRPINRSQSVSVFRESIRFRLNRINAELVPFTIFFLRHAIILSSLFLLNFCLGAIPTKIMREKFHRRLNCYVNTENARLRRKTLAKRDEREQRVGAPPTQSKRGWRRRGGGGGGLMLLADCTE